MFGDGPSSNGMIGPIMIIILNNKKVVYITTGLSAVATGQLLMGLSCFGYDLEKLNSLCLGWPLAVVSMHLLSLNEYGLSNNGCDF